jgi:hypothetical protein
MSLESDIESANKNISLLVEKYKQYNYTRKINSKPTPSYVGVPITFINGNVFLMQQRPFSEFPRDYKGWAGIRNTFPLMKVIGTPT